MAQAVRVLSAALVELGLGLWIQGAPGAVLLYVGGVSLAVALSMAAGFTGLLGKRCADGALSPALTVIFWPWHLLVWLSLLLQRGVLREEVITEVHPGWWLAGWPNDAEAFTEWPAVLDLTVALPRRVPAEPYLCLPTWDGTPVSAEDVERAASWLVAQRQSGREVLVHCAHGHSRSAAVMAAGLARAGLHPSWEEALEHLVERRRGVHLSSAQRRVMQHWAGRG